MCVFMSCYTFMLFASLVDRLVLVIFLSVICEEEEEREMKKRKKMGLQRLQCHQPCCARPSVPRLRFVGTAGSPAGTPRLHRLTSPSAGTRSAVSATLTAD